MVDSRHTNPEVSIKSPSALFIGGQWVKSSGSKTLQVISPVTEKVLMTFPEATPQGHGPRGRRGT